MHHQTVRISAQESLYIKVRVAVLKSSACRSKSRQNYKNLRNNIIAEIIQVDIKSFQVSKNSDEYVLERRLQSEASKWNILNAVCHTCKICSQYLVNTTYPIPNRYSILTLPTSGANRCDRIRMELGGYRIFTSLLYRAILNFRF